MNPNFFSRLLKLAALPLLAAALASCSTLIGPREIDVPQEKLQQSLDRRFPLHQRALAVFEVELSHPRLAIIPESGRVALNLDARVSPLLARQSWNGALAMSGRLRVDRYSGAVYVDDPHIDRFTVDGMDEGRQNQLASVANLLAERVLKDVPLHTFKPEDLRYAGVQFVVAGITTAPGKLVARVEPAQ
ncbi:DUF1439 domain-containing protein [Oxalobacteraceae bacterium A2-2]